MNTRLILTATVGLCAAVGLGGLLLQTVGKDPAPTASDTVEAVKSEPPAPMTADLVPLAAVPPPLPGAPVITYPDGTNYPTLNGVTTPVKLNWTSGRPYSPIVGTMYDGELNQLYWYAHEDGSFSTTAMLQQSRGGPLVPMGIVQAKLESLPASMMARSRDK